ncbi:MAG TPA: stage II sporulation protein M [Peptococcaceae bacterium]|nr:stage II sporulation protein M [Peptococcaceae bacterium]
MKKILAEHIRQYWIIYLTLCCVFLAGVVFGALGVGALNPNKTAHLTQFLNTLLEEQPRSINPAFLRQLAQDNFLIMAGIWLLGLTVIGTPLVYLIVFTRGFVFGFTIAFILHIKKLLGFGLVLVTLLVPSLLAIPCLLLGSGLATIFSFLLLQGKSNGRILKQDFSYYCAASLLVSLGAIAAGVLQGYFSLLGVRLLVF